MSSESLPPAPVDLDDSVLSDSNDELERVTLSDIPVPPNQQYKDKALVTTSQQQFGLEQDLLHLKLQHPALAAVPSSPTSVIATENVLNPFELRSEKSLAERNAAILHSLSFHAVELSIECNGMVKMDFFSQPACFVAVFVPGTAAGQWDLLDRSEVQCLSPQVRFVKNFRLRAATVVDREEHIRVAVFDADAKMATLDPLKAWAYQQFTVEDLLNENQMMTDKDLKSVKKGVNVRGCMTMALEMVYHVEANGAITFDLGFAKGAPMRNRMYFIISRALAKGKWTPIYRSEVRHRDDASKFEPVTVSTQEFHSGNVNKLFRIELHRAYKNGKSKLLGFVQTNLQKLQLMDQDSQLYWWPAREGITAAKVTVQYAECTSSDYYFSLRVAGH